MNDQDFATHILCIYTDIVYFTPGSSLLRSKLVDVLKPILHNFYGIYLNFLSNHTMGIQRDKRYAIDYDEKEKVEKLNRSVFSEQKELFKLIKTLVTLDASTRLNKSTVDKFLVMKSLFDLSVKNYYLSSCKKFAILYYLNQTKFILDQLIFQDGLDNGQKEELINSFEKMIEHCAKEMDDDIYLQLFLPEKLTKNLNDLREILPKINDDLLKIIITYTASNAGEIDEVILSLLK
jgi:hypothetical protein